MKTQRIVILAVAFVIASGTPAFADDVLTITLNKAAYTPGDAFSAVVTNTSSRTVRYLAMAIEHKPKNGTWKLIRRDTTCPCRAKCEKRVLLLAPGQKRTERWNFVGCGAKGASAPVATGTYRAAIYVWGPTMKKQFLAGKSVPFTFKR